MTDYHLWQDVQLNHNILITTANIMIMIIVTIIIRMSVILLISNIIHNNDMHYNFLIISIICDFLKIIFFHVSFQNIKESQHADTLPDC